MHLLATCYFRSDQAYRAYHLLQSAPTAWHLFLSLSGLHSLTCSCLSQSLQLAGCHLLSEAHSAQV